jgi:transcription initiation factor TFIID subunit 15
LLFKFTIIMRFTTLLPMLLAASVAQAQFGQNNGGNNGQNGGNNNGQNGGNNGQNGGNNGQNGGNNGQNGGNNGGNNNGNNALALNPNVVQQNSQSDGLEQAEAGQAASAT